jgi:aminomethyltransferase
MVPFAGYEMPVQYEEGILAEHINCRTNASIFDVSHMGQVRIHGKDRFDFLESLVVGDIKELKPGSATLSVFTNERGGIIDDTIITNMENYMYITFKIVI